MIVEAAAAALQGAPIVTQDVDLWFKSVGDPGITKALAKVGGAFVPSIGLRPPAFAGEAVELFDIVLTMHGLGEFHEEMKHAFVVKLNKVPVRVLGLDRIIKSKEAIRRPKDLLMIPVLKDAWATIKSRKKMRRKPISKTRALMAIAILTLGAAFVFSPVGSAGRTSSQVAAASLGPAAVDLDGEKDRQVVVDREKGQYLGHPTTCLLEDGKTILCVYPQGHGRGPIVYKRSADGGLTWGERLPTPPSWETSLETPTIHRVSAPDGTKRLLLFSGLYPARMARSEDDGRYWSELTPIGEWGGIVVMGSVVPLQTGPGRYLAMFHDDGRFFGREPAPKNPVEMTLYKTFSEDGGLSWSFPEEVYRSSFIHVCEPGVVRSPDGKRLAALLRENTRRRNSQIIFSDDEGKTWTPPRDLPEILNGDRHTAKYAPDGRLLVSFRRVSPQGAASPYEGDWVAWVGVFEDLVEGRSGQYIVRLKDNLVDADCAYPGVEVLPDGTFVLVTYGHWERDEGPYILCVRLKLSELYERVGKRPNPARSIS